MRHRCFLRACALVLAVCLSVAMLAGCGADEKLEELVRANREGPYDDAFSTFSPDTVMVSVGEADITWQALFHWIYYSTTEYERRNGEIEDWRAVTASGKTVAETIQANALAYALEYAYMEAGARGMGLDISQKLEDTARAEMMADAQNYESYDEFLQALADEYTNEEYYLYTKEMAGLYSTIYYAIYGENGSYLADQDVLSQIQDDGYLMCKQIVFLKIDRESGEPLPEEEIAAKRSDAEWILQQLGECKSDSALETRFDELVQKYTEDANYVSNPNGYLFQAADFEPAVVEAVQALGNYEYSGLVETDTAIYILLSLPINPDVQPYSLTYYTSGESKYTLRYQVSVKLYNEMVASWSQQYPAVFSEEYSNMDLAALMSGE